MDSATPSTRPLIWLVALLLFVLVSFHLGSALAGYPLYRDIHLGTALEYAKGKVDLLRPVIVGFNATGTPTAEELPLWQAAAAVAFKLARSTWYGWANVISLLLFSTCLWPFFQLARAYLDERGAWWALTFFLAQPLILLFAGQAGTDGFCAVLMIWFLFFADRMVRSGVFKWWLPAAIFGSLTAVSKLPFFMAAGFCAFFLLVLDRVSVRSWRHWALLASVGTVSGAVFVLWTTHSNDLAAMAEFPYYELRVGQSQDTALWFFGNWHTRLDPATWAKGGWRILNGMLGSFTLLALPIGGLMMPGNRIAKFLVLGGFLTTLVFSNLVLVHWHYYLMISPAVALLCGAGFRRLEQSLPSPWTASRVFPVATGVVLLLALVQGLMGMKIALAYDPYTSQVCAVLREYTKPGDRLIVLNGGWGGAELFGSNREGLSVEFPDRLAQICEGNSLCRLQELGYDRLVMLSESPLRAALQQANPGSRHARQKYPVSVSTIVDAWPVIFQSEDLIIKAIPAANKVRKGNG